MNIDIDDINNDLDKNNSSDNDNIENITINSDELFSNEQDDIKSSIVKMDEDIDNINIFIKHMKDKGYASELNRFLTKNFAESTDIKNVYHINITIDNEIITAITGYNKNNKIVNIPQAILETVQKDIQNSLHNYM